MEKEFINLTPENLDGERQAKESGGSDTELKKLEALEKKEGKSKLNDK